MHASRTRRTLAWLLALLFLLALGGFASASTKSTNAKKKASHAPAAVSESWMTMQDGWYNALEEGMDAMDPMTAQFTAGVIGCGDMSYDTGMSFLALTQDAMDVTAKKKDGQYTLEFDIQDSAGTVIKKSGNYTVAFDSIVVREANMKFATASGAFHMDVAFLNNDQCPLVSYLDVIPAGNGFYTCYIYQDDSGDYGDDLVIKQYMDKNRIVIAVDKLPGKADVSKLRLQKAPSSYAKLAEKDSMVITLDKTGQFKLSQHNDALGYKLK